MTEVQVGTQIRNALERRRRELGLSYSEVARRVGITTPATLNAFKSDGDLRLRSLHRLADALGLDVSILFTDVGVVGSPSEEVGGLPGLRKTAIASRFVGVLSALGAQVMESSFDDGRFRLPWSCSIAFEGSSPRNYSIYFWTISHGGKTRRADEYRIQTKLEHSRSLEVEGGTTILAGYYNEATDIGGKDLGNKPPEGMEVFVFWNALDHLHLGRSSSCQVRFETMYRAYLRGAAVDTRQIAGGRSESVVAVRPEKLRAYLEAAAGGHSRVDVGRL